MSTKKKPAPAKPGASSHPFTDALHIAIKASGMTPYAICKATGVSQAVLSRWLSGERDIKLTTADKIAAGLGLTVRVGDPA